MKNEITLHILEKLTVKEFEEYKILQADSLFTTTDLGLVETLLKGKEAVIAEKVEQGEKPAKEEEEPPVGNEAENAKNLLVADIAKIQAAIDEIIVKKAELGDKPLHHATQAKLEKLQKDLEDSMVSLEALEETFDDEKEF